MSKAQPLKEKLLSQSPDPVKASILRESGAGWSSPPSVHSRSGSSNGVTSPLRIAKRESPRLDAAEKRPAIELARRSSSSYKHLRHNLVTHSPFKNGQFARSPSRPSGVQFPSSPRRVSGEKRPRPQSMHEDAETENERPLALKRERRQSKAYLGLVSKEPVTNSPFRHPDDPPLLSPPAPRAPLSAPRPRLSISRRVAVSQSAASSKDASPPPNNPSPIRSSLVSRRLHGPRLSGKRGRRKTVTFYPKCDVVEFDRDEYRIIEGEDPDGELIEGEYYTTDEEGSGYEDNYDNPQSDDIFINGEAPEDEQMQVDGAEEQHLQPPPQAEEGNASLESVNLSDAGSNSYNADADTSIAGFVDEILGEADGQMGRTSTPPRPAHDIPTDLDTEDGVPFGHSHHIQRAEEFHRQEHEQPHPKPPSPPQFSAEATFGGPPRASSTPPQTPDRSAVHSPPLGRSTHVERIHAARAEEKEEHRMEEDVSMLPPSPSPAKWNVLWKAYAHSVVDDADGSWSGDRSFREEGGSFSRHEEEARPRSRLQEEIDRAMDPSNLSIGNSEISLDGLDRDALREVVSVILKLHEFLANDFSQEALAQERPTTPSRPLPKQPEPRQSMADLATSSPRESPASYARSPPQVTSPTATHLERPSSSQSNPRPSPSPRPRITREDIQQRIRRQLTSPTGSPSASRQGSPEDQEEQQPPTSLAVREDKERDRMSVLTNFSTETSTVEMAKKTRVSVSDAVTVEMPKHDECVVEEEFGMLKPSNDKLKLDFGSKFGLGRLQLGDMDIDVDDDAGSLDPPRRPESMLSGSVQSDYEVSVRSSTRSEVVSVDVDMDMRSALDRLMESMGNNMPAPSGDDHSMITEEDEGQRRPHSMPSARGHPMERAATDTALLGKETAFLSRTASGASTESVPPPPPPPKDKIRTREQLILEKRRERRAEQYSEDFTPSRPRHLAAAHPHGGRGSRRRSRSTGDVLQDVEPLDVAPAIENDTLLQESIERELIKMEGGSKSVSGKYLIRERETIYASSSKEKVSHVAGPGDVNVGKAWRPVRRPSDMNEYAKQIRELRAHEGKSKAYGKVFVKVVEVKGIHLPLPEEPTKMSCTLNNGIHFVTTPEVELKETSAIEQEFELIEHSKLEFTLTLKIKRDPHIAAQFKAIVPPRPVAPPPPPPIVHQTSSKSSGLRSLFGGSSPKKKEKHVSQPAPPPLVRQPLPRLTNNFARYLKPDGTMARAFVSYKEIAPHCDTRLFSTTYPLIGQRFELGNKWSNLQVGEIQLQVFRLPPMPGIPQNQLPQSLDECARGLRHVQWHKITYFEGTLTQNGGDCTSWRRRQFRVIGGSLVAFNDVTKRAIATIDIKKAIALQDDDDARRRALSPTSGSSAAASRYLDEMDGLCGVERSFRLIFPGDEEILFFADSDEEKDKWLQVLRALVGKIPPHPLWAEVLWQRQHEQQKQAAAGRGAAR
ncbi:hypothetical protein HDZ31DRAFT_34757 [Schizophyllum fasciatum]